MWSLIHIIGLEIAFLAENVECSEIFISYELKLIVRGIFARSIQSWTKGSNLEYSKPCLQDENILNHACRLRMGTSSPETGSDMDKIPQKSGRSFKIPQKGTRSFRMGTKSPETGTDMDKIPQGTNSG